ncbi:MAG: cyclic nucleotide-binding domain-containing protein [Thermoanaerobaculia bacterium]|nr:cyclic nucleotide-binding domain-containing protein [Thermoanaerobaculia bacterium]
MAEITLFQNEQNTEPFEARQTIFREGEPGDALFVVVEGELDVQVAGKTVEIVRPGGIVGEMALIDREPRSATVLARTSGRFVRIDEKRFMFLVQQTPFFALQVMRIMAERLRRMDSRVGKKEPG